MAARQSIDMVIMAALTLSSAGSRLGCGSPDGARLVSAKIGDCVAGIRPKFKQEGSRACRPTTMSQRSNPAWMSPIETRFAICVIVLGALISLLQVLDTAPWVSFVTAALGAAVTISRAVDTLLRPREAYRKAAEGMKREYRLYLHNADAYAAAEDEAGAYRLLVERVETILAEEQQLFWQSQAKEGAQKEPPPEPGA